MGTALAERAIADKGDPLHEWREVGPTGIVHIRRRLTDLERSQAGNLKVCDIRGTDEERRRLARLFKDAPHLRTLFNAR
jgi:hypothetical protein